MDTSLFTIDKNCGTQQYYYVMPIDKDDEQLAQSALLNIAKTNGMIECCFLKPSKELNKNLEELICYRILANPFHSEKN